MDASSGDPIRRFASWLVLSQVAMAASAAALVFACSQVLERPISPWWYPCAFLGSWAVYLRDSAASCDAEDSISQPRRAAIFRGSTLWCVVLPMISGALAVAFGLLARPSAETLVLLGVVGVLGLLHALPSSRNGRKKGFATKRFAAVKSIVVSIAWAVAAVGLPVLESGGDQNRSITMAAIWLAMLLVPLLLADSLLLDLRDRLADRDFGLRTIAVRVGPRGIHALVGSLLGLGVMMILLGASDAIDPIGWRRIGLAGCLGLFVTWLAWPILRRDEPGLAIAVMAWRFLAAVATAT